MPIPPPSHSALVVRTLMATTLAERENVLRDVEYNVFAFPAALIICDFLSDCGTSGMTDVQWVAVVRGDGGYGRNSGYYYLRDAFCGIFKCVGAPKRNFHYVVADTANAAFYRSEFFRVHQGGLNNGSAHQLTSPNFFILLQGCCTEVLLFSSMKEMLLARTGENTPQQVIISNGFFDTMGTNASIARFKLQSFLQPRLRDHFLVELVSKKNSFKGNLDIAATEKFLCEHAGRIALILIITTNNFAAGQPASMANIRQMAAIAKRYGIRLFFVPCRFAENAKFIQVFENVDGFTISLKKDSLANMGRALCFQDGGLFTQKLCRGDGEVPNNVKIEERQVLCYDNGSYSDMSGRDPKVAAVGLYEVTKEYYIYSGIGQARSFVQKLHANGVSMLLLPNGHPVYLDIAEVSLGCNCKPEEFASVSFTLKLLKDYKIRPTEAVPITWEFNRKATAEYKNIPDLVCFAGPQNVMNDKHIDYTVAAISQLLCNQHMIPGVKITQGAEFRLRNFQSSCASVPVSISSRGTYFSEAQSQISHLRTAIGLTDRAGELLDKALALAMQTWGNLSVPERLSGWLSDVSLDNSPIEYSLAINHKTNASQLRFLIEAQAEEHTLAGFQKSALCLTDEIGKRYRKTVSLERFHLISDLFFPKGNEAQGLFAAWHSCCVSNSDNLEWKLYLNPRARGLDSTATIIRDALGRLGMTEAYSMLEGVMTPTDEFIYFALDLHSGQHARVKIYVKHTNADASAIADKFAICPHTSKKEVRRFLTAMSGSLGPYSAKPVISCFAFTSNALRSPSGTVHFPISNYAPHDAEIKRRIEVYTATISSTLLATYRRAINALQRRPLQQGRGLHSYVSLNNKSPGPITTFYISAELFNMLPLEAKVSS